jgi:UDP-N-acetylmuramoylalanine--D-glutamate ligase
MNVTGQHFLVLGMGNSGLNAARLLLREGARVTATDSRPLEQLPQVAAANLAFRPDTDFSTAGIDAIVVSPGVHTAHPLLRTGLPVLGEIELAYLFLQGPVIAITGSNGKTTTTALTGHILEAANIARQVGGNIGTALTSLTASSRPLQWNVVELSSFQLETVNSFRADIAAVLNVTPNHLDRHGSMEAYAAAKRNIFRNQRPADHAVLNAANDISISYATATSARKSFFNAEAAALHNETVELFGKKLMTTADIPLPGRHNLDNIMAAAVICSLAGAPNEAIAQAVSTFMGVPHRLQFVREWRGIRFYNDSKATSVDAALKALDALQGPLWIILGGLDKGGSYLPLAPLLQEKAKGALLIGKAASIIEEQLRGTVPLTTVGTLDKALAHLAANAQPGDTILLAPACASYDQFRGFEHRGDTFRDLVNAL